MIRNDYFGIRTAEGKELIRVRGVYMYVILVSGKVAALVGHKTLTVTAMDYPDDKSSVLGYLKVGKWVYPLARKVSPVVISEENAIVVPDAFCETFEDAKYVAIKLPESMTIAEKKVLERVLGVFADLTGMFKPLYHKAYSAVAPYILNKPMQLHFRTNSDKIRRSIVYRYKYKETREKMKTPTYRYRSKSIDIPLCLRPFKRPLIRHYTIGPKDPVFITIDTNPVWIKLNFILFRAIHTVLNKLTERYNYKKGLGIVPNFDSRFAFYLRDVSEPRIVRPPISLIEDTKWAAAIFDETLRNSDFELVDFETPQDDLLPPMMEHKELEQDLIVRHLMSRYKTTSYLFCTMVAISEIETFRDQKTKTVPRILEHCDHRIIPFTECYHE